jgi:putative effector of murein hydrolase
VVVLGFYFSCSTVAFSVQLLRQVTTKNKIAPTKTAIIPDTSSKPKVLGKSREKKAATQVPVPPPPPPVVKQFLESTLHSLAITSLVSGVISIVATRKQFQYATSLQAVFHFISTVTAYVWASLLPSSFTKFVHPLVTSTTLTWLLMQLTALATDSTFKTVLATYKAGSLHWSNCGAGDHLLNLLGPSVIAFAVAMYSRKKLLQENLAIVLIAMIVSAGGGLFGTAAFVRAIQLGGKNGALVRLSVLSRNVTTALAIAVTSILGGNISIASSVVVLTGIFAATFGRSILTSMGIHDPVARGLGIGGAGQGLGVASMSLEPDAFPFAAMSMVLTAVCATILVSIPSVKDVLVQLAVGP